MIARVGWGWFGLLALLATSRRELVVGRDALSSRERVISWRRMLEFGGRGKRLTFWGELPPELVGLVR